jgi:hypothetical protein
MSKQTPIAMKSLRLDLPEALYDELKALCTHRGELVHLIREGVKMIIYYETEKRKAFRPPITYIGT